MRKEEAEKEFEEYREYLHFEAQRLASYIRLYHHLHERMKDRMNVINMSPTFFQVTIDALFTAIVLCVDKLFGERSERGFLDFLSFVGNNRSIFTVDELKRRKGYPDDHWMLNRQPITLQRIENDRLKIKQIESLSSFKLRRNKSHAHFDKEYFLDKNKLGEHTPMKRGDLSHLVHAMVDILNTYSAAYDGNMCSLGPLNINDVDRILDLLNNYGMRK